MKVASKHFMILACIVTGIGVVCIGSRRGHESTVDVWTSDGGRPAHVRASAATGVCTPSGPTQSGWELRLDGSAGDAVRRVDLEIPRAESSGTAAFFAGVTTVRDGVLRQWTVETRVQAARRSGEGRAWAESTDAGVNAAIIARLESAWYFVTIRCSMPE